LARVGPAAENFADQGGGHVAEGQQQGEVGFEQGQELQFQACGFIDELPAGLRQVGHAAGGFVVGPERSQFAAAFVEHACEQGGVAGIGLGAAAGEALAVAGGLLGIDRVEGQAVARQEGVEERPARFLEGRTCPRRQLDRRQCRSLGSCSTTQRLAGRRRGWTSCFGSAQSLPTHRTGRAWGAWWAGVLLMA
jgi:hypothetical protein